MAHRVCGEHKDGPVGTPARRPRGGKIYIIIYNYIYLHPPDIRGDNTLRPGVAEEDRILFTVCWIKHGFAYKT